MPTQFQKCNGYNNYYNCANSKVLKVQRLCQEKYFNNINIGFVPSEIKACQCLIILLHLIAEM